jgi:hypothetical protein
MKRHGETLNGRSVLCSEWNKHCEKWEPCDGRNVALSE